EQREDGATHCAPLYRRRDGCRRADIACDNWDMTVAVVGASSDRRKFGNKAVRAFTDAGHKVIPINPNEPEVEGVRTYASVTDVPDAIDMATVYVPPEIGITLLEGFEQKRIGEVWINPGAESDE